MCRGLHDTCAQPGRRCPSSLPSRRSAYRKAHAAARAAAQGEPIAPGYDTDAGFDPGDLTDPRARTELARQISAALTSVSYSSAEQVSVSTAAEAHLTARYGGVEPAVRALGAAVTTRAEELAGITGEQVREGVQARFGPARARLAELEEEISHLERELSEKHGGGMGYFTDELRAERRALWDDQDRGSAEWEARWEEHRARVDASLAAFEAGPAAPLRAAQAERESLSWARANIDEQGREQLRQLSEGYRDAIAEMRDVGGETTWHPKTSKKAQELFEATTGYFPSDWMAASAGRGPMIAKLQRSRAHYSAGHTETTRKKVQSRDNWVCRTPEDEARIRADYADTPYYEVADEVVKQSWDDVLPVYAFEVASRYSHPGDGPPPRGRGWQRWVSADGTQSAWRRPRTRMETVSSEQVAEIKSYLVPSGADLTDPMTTSYATAVHEWQHRFEHTVPGISRLEAQFLARRAGEDEQLETIYKGTKERGYRDDFVEHYMGKVYSHGGYYEIMSMGAESLFSGQNGGLVGAHSGGKMHADDDMRAFVLGTYVSAGRSDADPETVLGTLAPEHRERYEATMKILGDRDATPVNA